ncbi:11057_t:CDS:2, partial [Acaulospora colombiana]
WLMVEELMKSNWQRRVVEKVGESGQGLTALVFSISRDELILLDITVFAGETASRTVQTVPTARVCSMLQPTETPFSPTFEPAASPSHRASPFILFSIF